MAPQSRYKTFSDVAVEKQSYHFAQHWQAYIHIATKEILSDISRYIKCEFIDWVFLWGILTISRTLEQRNKGKM